MSKHVKSTDPRKAVVVHALKKKSGGTKVTMVTQLSETVFEGRCLKPEFIKENGFTVKTGKFVELGQFKVYAGVDFPLEYLE